MYAAIHRPPFLGRHGCTHPQQAAEPLHDHAPAAQPHCLETVLDVYKQHAYIPFGKLWVKRLAWPCALVCVPLHALRDPSDTAQLFHALRPPGPEHRRRG